MGGFGWVIIVGFDDPDADWPGLGGLIGGWAGMISSSPDSSESLFDSEIGRSFADAWSLVTSFAGNRVSSNFTSQEILMRWWAASQNWYPLEPGSQPMKIISRLFGSSLDLLFFRMCTQA